MFRLLAIWILFIQAHQPDGKVFEFPNERAEFATQEDCEAYAASQGTALLGLKFVSGKAVSFPEGTTGTHDCRMKP